VFLDDIFTVVAPFLFLFYFILFCAIRLKRNDRVWHDLAVLLNPRDASPVATLTAKLPFTMPRHRDFCSAMISQSEQSSSQLPLSFLSEEVCFFFFFFFPFLLGGMKEDDRFLSISPGPLKMIRFLCSVGCTGS
jgi:hypothetical protein